MRSLDRKLLRIVKASLRSFGEIRKAIRDLEENYRDRAAANLLKKHLKRAGSYDAQVAILREMGAHLDSETIMDVLRPLGLSNVDPKTQGDLKLLQVIREVMGERPWEGYEVSIIDGYWGRRGTHVNNYIVKKDKSSKTMEDLARFLGRYDWEEAIVMDDSFELYDGDQTIARVRSKDDFSTEVYHLIQPTLGVSERNTRYFSGGGSISY